MTRDIDFSKIVGLEFQDIHMWDYPDFCDAYISAASWEDGTELTDDELDKLNEDRDYVYEKLMDYLY